MMNKKINTVKCKVGLVPLMYKEYNYGGVLQFYALQKILLNQGVECNIIHYSNNDRIIYDGESSNNNAVNKIKVCLYKMINFKNLKELENVMYRRKKRIDEFKKKYYLPIVEEDALDYKSYEAIICGSDQIWNPNWARKRNFLEFVPDTIKKIIYAASLGVEEMSPNQKKEYKWRIERLQYVSVREYSAKSLLDSFIDNLDIKVVLDPTLLLMRDEWEIIVNDKTDKLPNSSYILTYFLGEHKSKVKVIREIADKLDVKVVNIPFASGDSVDRNIFGEIQVFDADPSEFLSLIKNAQCILTDSFHACVFSVIFKRDFYVFKRDGKKAMLGRINTLMSNFSITNRIIDNTFKAIDYKKIDYVNTDRTQELLRQNSIAFLTGAIFNE